MLILKILKVKLESGKRVVNNYKLQFESEIVMKYIALLRGINISGKNKIVMSELKKEFTNMGYKEVITYLNSGNVVFESDIKDKNAIKNNIQLMIKDKFKFDIPIQVITSQELEELIIHSPDWWGKDNKEIYDNIIFIIPPTTYNEVFDTIGSPNEYEKIQEYKNNIFWSFDLKNYRKANWWSKTASTNISGKITIRTANTMKKILEISKR